MSGKHVIVLNGKRYDTKTGQLVHAPAKTHAQAAKSKPASTRTTATSKPVVSSAARAKAKPRSIDGFTKPSHPKATTQQPNRPANHAARKPQRSHTVMRAATKHPVINVAKPVEGPPPQAIIETTPSTLGVNPDRVQRAKHVHQDKRISRFGIIEPAAPSAVAPAAPIESEEQASSPQAVALPQSIAPQATTPETHIERAIAAATSHTQPKADHKPAKRHHRVARKLHMKPRTLTTAATALLVVGVGGILIRQNMPSLQVQLASNRAGVSSSLPSYVPAGYNLADGVDYKQGEITLTYQSRTDDQRTFTITQAESFWTSESLKQNYLENLEGGYQTVQENGKTIYLYDDGATWVDGGVWYKVEAGDANLSSTQMIDLINGL